VSGPGAEWPPGGAGPGAGPYGSGGGPYGRSGGPYGGGGGQGGRGGGPGARGGAPRRRPLLDNPRAVLWVIGIVAVVAILVRAHRITGTEVILFCVVVPSIILHEIAHGWVALAFGDDTAKRAGRLTLNPVAHVDPVGTLIVPALLALSGIGMFGWAKPVPVDLRRLRHPRNEGVVVSLAGPATNVLLALVAYIVFRSFHGADTYTTLQPDGALWAQVAFLLGLVNVWLAVFNMVPVPPLDGSVLLERFLPRSWWPGYLRLRPYTMPILIGLLLLNFYLNPGPLTWLYDHLQSWWIGVLS
jgi:Zn-dependent protease